MSVAGPSRFSYGGTIVECVGKSSAIAAPTIGYQESTFM